MSENTPPQETPEPSESVIDNSPARYVNGRKYVSVPGPGVEVRAPKPGQKRS